MADGLDFQGRRILIMGTGIGTTTARSRWSTTVPGKVLRPDTRNTC